MKNLCITLCPAFICMVIVFCPVAQAQAPASQIEGKSSDELANKAATNEAATDKTATNEAATNEILPGRQAGKLILGMTSEEALRLMGKPREMRERSVGIQEISWWPNQLAGQEVGTLATVATFASDKLIQVTTGDSSLYDQHGLSARSTLAEVIAQYRSLGYPLPKVSAFAIFTGEEPAYEAYVYDDVGIGIAYIIFARDHFDHSVALSKIAVHRPGTAFMPPKGATPVTPTLNKPVAPPPTPVAAKVQPPRKAQGSGLPITETVNSDGVRGMVTTAVVLPSRVLVIAGAQTTGMAGRSLWHPFPFIYVAAVGQEAVWQDANAITLSFGYRRLQLSAQKQTRENADYVSTGLFASVPYRDFLDLARAEKFYITVSNNTFVVDKPQTVGLRVVARSIGAGDISLSSGNSQGKSSRAGSSLKNSTSKNGSVRGSVRSGAFFEETRTRRLSRGEIEQWSDTDLRVAINEIYARYGYVFKDQELRTLFQKTKWYKPRAGRSINDIVKRLSSHERHNVNLLVAERKRRGQ